MREVIKKNIPLSFKFYLIASGITSAPTWEPDGAGS